MTASTSVLCGVCDARHITKSAEHWCPECEEGLCFDCQAHHMVSKASRNHEVISVDSYKKLPAFISKILQYCTDHDLKYTNFCRRHNALCCPVCISSSHTDCLGIRMISVEEMLKSFKTSATLESIEQCCNDLKCNIDKVMEDRKQNIAKIQEQRRKVQTDILQLRVKINSHLDRLEKDFIAELLAAEKKIKFKIEALLTKLYTVSVNVDMLLNNIRAVKDYASDLQTFLGSKTIEAEVEKAEKCLHSLIEVGSLQHLKLTCHLNERISQIVSTVTTFGSVSIDTSPPCVHLKTKRDKQAQIMSIVQPTRKSVNDITLTLDSSFNILRGKNENSIRGCTVCPNMNIMFADNDNGRLVILTLNSKLSNEISCCLPGCGPNDVTSIDDKIVAITTQSGIQIINIESKRTERTIETKGYCCGITHHEGALLWCEQFKGIQMLHLTDKSVTTVVKQDTLKHCWSYITTLGDKIYQTDFCNHKVTCFTTKGDKLWVYKDKSGMMNPTCVAVDNNYNVYITSRGTDTVVVLSSDGKQSRKLLGQKNGLYCAWALHYDKCNNKLLACNYEGRVFRYDVST